jgi:hypothetical protein
MGVLFMLTGSCNKEKTEPKKVPITAENILGKWYLKSTDASSGLTFIFYLDNAQDSARVGMLNGNEEVELIRFAYMVNNGSFSFVSPAVDTMHQNALQIYLADYMKQMFYNDKVYLQDGNLCFAEGPDVYAFTPVIPNIPGGKISGSLTVSNGSFGQGMAMIVAVDVSTKAMQGTFVVHTGQYTVMGLVNGQYNVMAVYIPKKHATDFLTLDVSEFPKELIQTPIAISGGNIVTGFNLNIDLGSSGNIKKASVFPKRYSAILSKILYEMDNKFKPHLK